MKQEEKTPPPPSWVAIQKGGELLKPYSYSPPTPSNPPFTEGGKGGYVGEGG